jgi:hypothetical protein
MEIVALFGSLGRKRSHATKLLPLSLASPSPWPHSAPSHFPHSCGCRLIAQATMARPAAILPGSHGLAPRTTCSRPYQSHNRVQIRAREKRSAPPVTSVTLSPQPPTAQDQITASSSSPITGLYGSFPHVSNLV